MWYFLCSRLCRIFFILLLCNKSADPVVFTFALSMKSLNVLSGMLNRTYSLELLSFHTSVWVEHSDAYSCLIINAMV